MNKLFDLRETLLTSGLSISPENITVMTKSGTVQHHYRRELDRGNNKFKKTFDAEVFVFDHIQDINPVLFIVAQWLTKNQPGHAEDVISYQLEILDHERADILVTLKGITETVNVTENQKGIYMGACAPEHLDPIVRAAGIASTTSALDKTKKSP